MPQAVSIVNTSVSPVANGHKSANGTAAALASTSSLKRGVIIKNPSDSGVDVYVGASTVTSSTGFQLEPGEKEFFPISDPSLIYVVTSGAAATVSYIAI